MLHGKSLRSRCARAIQHEVARDFTSERHNSGNQQNLNHENKSRPKPPGLRTFRDGKASYNDIVWWPKGSWKNQSPTPNVNTRYLYFFINTKKDGPVVVDLPEAVPGASFYGTIEDAWYGAAHGHWLRGARAENTSCCHPTTKATCRRATSRCVPRPTTP
jgi:hypothetical protein